MGRVIPSSSNLKQLESNAAAAQIQLNVDQMERILHAVE
jgi:aryl-alcohol dehydrogenase-like predicted oxidoreductase